MIVLDGLKVLVQLGQERSKLIHLGSLARLLGCLLLLEGLLKHIKLREGVQLLLGLTDRLNTDSLCLRLLKRLLHLLSSWRLLALDRHILRVLQVLRGLLLLHLCEHAKQRFHGLWGL